MFLASLRQTTSPFTMDGARVSPEKRRITSVVAAIAVVAIVAFAAYFVVHGRSAGAGGVAEPEAQERSAQHPETEEPAE